MYKHQRLKINTTEPRIHYAGAISGSYGGPRVKVKLLKDRFDSKFLDFNIVYVLSNYPYLSQKSLVRIRDAGIPIILNQNGVFTQGWFGNGWEARNLPNIHAYEICDYVFWQSKFAKMASEKFLSSKIKSGEILYNAVNLTKFYPKKSRNRREFIFLVAGNFNSESSLYQIKSALMALANLNSYKNIKLQIAGLSSEMKKLTLRLAIDLKVNSRIDLLGRYKQSIWPEIVREADAYMALKFQDTCPNLVLEALASGLPVLYSSTGGTPELVDDKSGVGLPVDGNWSTTPIAPNFEEIAKAMEMIKNDSKEMSLAARSRAESKFDVEYWYERHEQIFNKFLESKSR